MVVADTYDFGVAAFQCPHHLCPEFCHSTLHLHTVLDIRFAVRNDPVTNNSAQTHFLKGWIQLAVLIGSIFLMFLGAEGLSRLLLWKSAQAHGPKLHDLFYFDRNGLFRIKPNSRGWHRGYDERPIMVELNSDGFRGPELRESPAKRIIFVGDSVVFDAGVQQEETFIALAEDYFERDGQDVEIINAGTPDVGVDQYWLQAKHNRFDNYKPDLIVIGLYLNDSRPPQGFLGENQDQIIDFLSHSPLKHLALTHYVRQAYIAFQLKRGGKFTERFEWVARYKSHKWMDNPSEFQQLVKEAQFDWGAAWNVSLETNVFPALMELRDQYARKGVKIAVVLFPVNVQVYTKLTDSFIDYPQRQMSKFATIADIPFFDLLPSLKRQKNLRPYADPAHLNRVGNRITADTIYPFLKAQLNKDSKKIEP